MFLIKSIINRYITLGWIRWWLSILGAKSLIIHAIKWGNVSIKDCVCVQGVNLVSNLLDKYLSGELENFPATRLSSALINLLNSTSRRNMCVHPISWSQYFLLYLFSVFRGLLAPLSFCLAGNRFSPPSFHPKTEENVKIVYKFRPSHWTQNSFEVKFTSGEFLDSLESLKFEGIKTRVKKSGIKTECRAEVLCER